MKVMITGSNGQLGSELRRILQKGVSELGPIPKCFIDAKLDCVDIEDLDITNLSDVSRHVCEFAPQLIINCASYTNVDACETHQDDAFKVNSLGARNMAVGAEMVGARIIYLSTDYVFSGDASSPYREYDRPEPQNVYGATKLAGERFVRDFCSRWFIVRTSWLYGYNGKNFVKTIMRLARERGTIKIVSDQTGNPTNAADLSHHILKIASAGEYGIYHCTGRGTCSWYDFADKIIEYSGIKASVFPCSSDEYQSPVKRPKYSALEHMALRCSVGDEMRKWQDALKYFLERYDGE
ncbi:MAG: dTDP-4-dehydrorhamnose reductase [Synergistaceae bacterium]|nr:dTDP-4-dehydrorhamnose reductase [Synergistaceae bacterium]